MKRSFASDNTSGVHPKILQALEKVASVPFTKAYGDDEITHWAQALLKTNFGPASEAHLVFNGTGANVLALATLLKPYESVLAAASSHLNMDECGALERFSGSKVTVIPTQGEKLTPVQLKPFLGGRRDQHRSQPRILTVSQSSEEGQIYTSAEIRALADFVHQNEMLLHIDGARFSNAAAALDVSLKALSADLGVDALSFGGTKNGLMFGEAVVFFNRPGSESFPYIRKQGLQLASKMRFLAAQFIAYMEDELWRKNAKHANAMARRLKNHLEKIPQVKITYPTDANVVFAVIPPAIIEKLIEDFYFYVWDETTSVVRLMCSFETQPDDVDALAEAIASAFKKSGL